MLPQHAEDTHVNHIVVESAQVSFQWKNPDFLLKNPDLLLKNIDFIIKQAAHFSIFRVNGDANYMKDAFYDLCDEVIITC